MTGVDATFHMVNEKFLQNLEKKPLIINSCRGEVFDSEACFNAIEASDISGFIADCWENEPEINLDLLEHAELWNTAYCRIFKRWKSQWHKNECSGISRFFNLGN